LQLNPSCIKLGSVNLQFAMAVRLVATRGLRLVPWGLMHEDLIRLQQFVPPPLVEIEPIPRCF